MIGCVQNPIARLILERPNDTVEPPLRILTEPAAAGPADWVLLCTKTHQTAAAAPWLKALCAPATRVAVMQNGIDHVARVAPLAGGATVLPVVVYYNGERLAADRVRLRQGADFDIAVANPPYIASAAIPGLAREVREHDPHRALDGGIDGLAAYRAIARDLPRLLVPGGLFAAEIGSDQALAVNQLMAAAGLAVETVLPDLAGLPRCVVAWC